MQTTAEAYTVSIVETLEERAAVFALRMQVFVEEQNVPPDEELDAYDLVATHFLARKSPEPPNAHLGIIGTARLLDKGDGLGKIGRVAIHAEHRGTGAGARIMRFAEEIARRQGFRELILEAQLHAEGFYARLGYVGEGDIFMDCNIPHRLMRKRLEANL